jgi:cytidyltransferase-like protein
MDSNSIQRRVVRILTNKAEYEDRYVPDHAELHELVHHLREMGCVIVFTSGVWDLFHIGHAEYINKGKEEARKKYPDAEHIIMVVGVDTDELTKSRKGPKRPIVPDEERRRVLGHLRSVDIITPQYKFKDLYKIIRPDVQIISASTQMISTSENDNLVNIDYITDNCTHLIKLDPQSETSTTARIRTLALDGSLMAIERVSAKLTRALEEARNELSL